VATAHHRHFLKSEQLQWAPRPFRIPARYLAVSDNTLYLRNRNGHPKGSLEMKPLLVVLAIAIAGIVYLLWELVGKHVKRDRLEHLVHHEDTPMHTDRLIGRVGQVVSTVTRVSGQIEIDGELWEARLAVPTNDIPEHSRVRVAAFEGTRLLVSIHAD